MAAITWRNVDAPNLGDPARTGMLASNSINNAFDILNKQLTTAQDVDGQNWDARKALNTDQYLSRLQSFKTPEEAAAAQAELQGLRQGFQAQIDMPAVRNVEANLTENLQRRVTTNNAYVTGQEDFAERDTVADLSAKIATGGSKALNEGLAAYPNLSARARATLAAAARKADFENEDQGFQRNADGRAQQALDLQRRQLAIQASEADARSADRRTQNNQLKLTDLMRQRELLLTEPSAKLESAKAALQGNMLTGVGINDAKGAEGVRKALTTTGVSMFSKANMDNFLDVLKQAGRGEVAGDNKGTQALKSVAAMGMGILNPLGSAALLQKTKAKQPFLDADGSHMLVPERNADGSTVIDPKTKQPKVTMVPLTADFVAQSILETKAGSIGDPSPEAVLDTMRRRMLDPTMRNKFLEYQQARGAITSAEEEIRNINRAVSDVALGREPKN